MKIRLNEVHAHRRTLALNTRKYDCMVERVEWVDLGGGHAAFSRKTCSPSSSLRFEDSPGTSSDPSVRARTRTLPALHSGESTSGASTRRVQFCAAFHFAIYEISRRTIYLSLMFSRRRRSVCNYANRLFHLRGRSMRSANNRFGVQARGLARARERKIYNNHTGTSRDVMLLKQRMTITQLPRFILSRQNASLLLAG